MFTNTGFNKSGFGSTGGMFGGQSTPASTNMFGGQNTTSTTQSTGLFGTSSTGFGQTSTQSTFGGFGQTPQQQQTNTGGLFGNTSQQSTGLFATPAATNNTFGAKTPASGLFGSTTQTTGGSLFGGTSTPAPAANTGGLFGNTGGAAFGTTAAAGGTTVKFNPPNGQDTMLKGGVTSNISTRHQCITAMKEYETKSLEELRFEDYGANRKGPQPGSTGLFGQTQTTQAQSTGFGGFNQNKTNNFSFGTSNAGATSTASSLFSQPQQTQQAGGLFGANASTKPLFGSTTTTTTQSAGFGGFGNTSNTLFGNQNKSLFGQTTGTQATGSIFGNTQTASTAGSTGFGGFGTSTQAAGGGLFGNKTTGFGQPTSSTGLTFGQNTLQQQSTGLFGNKPAGQTSTSFNFGQSTTGGFGTNTSSNLFGNKSTGFGTQTNTLTGASTTGFGSTLGGGTSGGLFGGTQNSSTLGFGNTFGGTTGFGTQSNTGALQNTATNNVLTQPAQVQDLQVQQQILSLTSSPYGDSPLFRNLTEDRAKRDDLLKPTNPLAQKAAISSGNQYKVNPRPTAKIKPKPLHNLAPGKAQLFDGLEDEESSFGNDTFVPRRNVKKLVINSNDSMSNASFSKHSSHAEDLDGSHLPMTSPTGKNNSQEDKNPLSESVLDQSDIQKDSLPRDKADRERGIFKNVNASFFNDTISDFNQQRGSSTREDSTTNSQELDEEEDSPPHPAGIVLKRPGYYIIPSLASLRDRLDANGDCWVDDLVVGREGFGNVMFPGRTNVANMNLDEIVFFKRKEITIYPDDNKKPPEGKGLNKKAQVTLDCVWPADKSTRDYIKSPSRLHDMRYQEKLERATNKIGAVFMDYRPETGSWAFEVKHFSKYGLIDDSDDEDEKPDPKNLALLKQQQQQQLAVQKQKIQQVPGQKLSPTPAESIQPPPQAVAGVQWADQQQQQPLPPQPVAPQEMAPPPVSARPLFSDDEDIDDLMEESEPKEMEEIDDTDLAPSSHRLAADLGVVAKELQLRKASFFGEDEEEVVPKWKAEMRKRSSGLLQPEVLEDSMMAQAEDKDASLWSPGQPLLATSFSRPSSKALSPKKRLHSAATQGLSPKRTEHLIAPPVARQPRPRPVVGTRIRRRIPTLMNSLFADKEHFAMDSGLMRSQSFQVGWGPDLSLVHAGKAIMPSEEPKAPEAQKSFFLLQQKGSIEKSRLGTDDQQLTIEQVFISNTEKKRENLPTLESVVEDHLNIQLEHTKLSVEGGSPQAVPECGNRIIQALADCSKKSQSLLASTEDFELYRQANLVWELCLALWGDLRDPKVDDPSPDSYAYHAARQYAFSEWLMSAVADNIEKDLEHIKVDSGSEAAAVFQHLSGFQLEEACARAQECGDHRMALVMAQAAGSDSCRAMIHKQLSMWEQSEMDHFVDEDRLKIYSLLSGNMVWTTSTDLTVNTCQDLDWKRALALHLWYQCPPTATIADALEAYNKSYTTTGDSEPYAVPPLPDYFNDLLVDPDDPVNKQHVCYHLIQLYCDRSHPLHSLLCPTSAIDNYLDFRLSWQLSRVLQGLEYTHLSEYHSATLCTSYSAQLEKLGLWHWAVFVLLHLTNKSHREHAIKQLLQRNVRIWSDEECLRRENFLQALLKIPAEWIHEAKAIHACSLNLREEEAWHWLCAAHWNRSHQLILTHLASTAIVNENHDDLKVLLCKLGSPEVSKTVVNWEKGGQVYLDYITMMETLQQLLESEPSAYELEKLQIEASQLSKRITGLECRTATDRLCKAEMAKKAATLMRTLLLMKDDEDVNEALVTATSDLPLPEDYALQELNQLTRGYLGILARS